MMIIKYQKPQSEPTIQKSNSLLSLQPLRLQNTDTYSDMAKTLGLYIERVQVQLGATINVLPHFSTNIPFYIK